MGAGAGATVGKFFGNKFAMKSGLGTASIRAGNSGIVVAAMAAVNAAGDVYDPQTAKIIAGARTEDGKGFRDTMAQIRNGYDVSPLRSPMNTTLGVVATNAKLTKDQATKIAQMAHDGLARAINPTHTPADGDTVFAVGTGAKRRADRNGGDWSARGGCVGAGDRARGTACGGDSGVSECTRFGEVMQGEAEKVKSAVLTLRSSGQAQRGGLDNRGVG